MQPTGGAGSGRRTERDAKHAKSQHCDEDAEQPPARSRCSSLIAACDEQVEVLLQHGRPGSILLDPRPAHRVINQCVECRSAFFRALSVAPAASSCCPIGSFLVRVHQALVVRPHEGSVAYRERRGACARPRQRTTEINGSRAGRGSGKASAARAAHSGRGRTPGTSP